MDRTSLIQAFMDTMRVAREDPAIAAATKLAQAGTALYLEGYEAILRPVKSDKVPVEVAGDTTFHCAQGLVNGVDRVAVLNFANAFNLTHHDIGPNYLGGLLGSLFGATNTDYFYED